MAMNIDSLIKTTKTVADETRVVFINNETREQTLSIDWSAHSFRGNHSQIAFDKSSGDHMTASDFRERLEGELGEEQEWGGNMGRGPVYTTTGETEVSITEDYRDSKGQIEAWFYNEASAELLFFIAG